MTAITYESRDQIALITINRPEARNAINNAVVQGLHAAWRRFAQEDDRVAAMLRGGTPVVADVEMICSGLSRPRLAHFGMSTHQFISDADVIAQAQAQNTTRAVQAMRKAHRLGLLQGAVVGIGNAPTALIELVRLIMEDGVRPALVVGMPVGFVSAAESKDLMAQIADVPWIVIRGRKGGSTLVVAALHALLALAEAQQRAEGA